MPQPILIDTDAGDDIDDVLAIAFALLRPELEVRAITTVSPGSRQRAGLIKRLLAATGHPDIPVAAGMELPLRLVSPQELAHITDLKRVLNHAGPDVTGTDFILAPRDGVSQIIQTVEEANGDLGIVGIGPLTNIACALRRRPEIAGQIRWIALMGGEVDLPRAEHNINWDYQAAAIVLNSGIPIFLGTWSVTRQFVLMPPDLELIAECDLELTRFLSPLIQLWWPYRGAKPGPVMYDIAPIMWAFAPEYYPAELMSLAVETRGELTRGTTVRVSGDPNVQVSRSMDAEGVRRLYLDTILGGRS